MVVTPPFTHRALLSVIRRGLAFSALPWMFVLWSSRRTVFVEAGSSGWMFSSATVHLCCSSSVIFRNSPSQCTTISFYQCLFSPAVPLRWCCLSHDACMPTYPYKPSLTIHLIMWQFLSQMLQLNAHQLSVLFQYRTSLPFSNSITRSIIRHNH
jgi:hypothetical protein